MIVVVQFSVCKTVVAVDTSTIAGEREAEQDTTGTERTRWMYKMLLACKHGCITMIWSECFVLTILGVRDHSE